MGGGELVSCNDIPKAYWDGVEARNGQAAKSAPAWLSLTGRSWWLAGWNDRDIELTS